MRRPSLAPLLAAALSALFAVGAHAQEKDAPKVEVGVQFTTLEVNPPQTFLALGTDTKPGFGGRVTYNLTDYLALEAESNFFPQRQQSFFGRTTQAQFGVKAGKRFEKFGIFAKARPGFVSFAEEFKIVEVQTHDSAGNPVVVPEFRSERETHFSMDVGGVLELYPSRRILTRFDAGDTIMRYGARNEFGATFPPLVRRDPEYRHNFQFSAGIGFRFMDAGGGGNTVMPRDSGGGGGEHAPRYEVGIQYTSLTRDLPTAICPDLCIGDFDPGRITQTGFGGRFTLNLNDNVAVEAEGNFFPKRIVTFTEPGGRLFQGQFGVKAGKRYESFGLFAKARPGFVDFTEVSTLTGTQVVNFGAQQFNVGVFRDKNKAYFSMDVGGVLEFYPSRRIVTRFDAGDTIIRYGEFQTQGFSLGSNILTRAAETRHSFQFNAGIGFRF